MSAELLVLSRRLDGLEQWSEALDRLKGDLASLRASLLGRAEDRGSMALALDRFRSDLSDLKVELSSLRSTTSLALEQLGERLKERRAAESELGARLSEMERAFKGRLEKVEHTGRRFEVFYDSRPVRLLRRLLVGASGRQNT